MPDESEEYNDRLLGTRWKYHYCPGGVTMDCMDHTIAEGADKPPKKHMHPPDLSTRFVSGK